MLRAMLNDREQKVRVAAAEGLVRIKSESNVVPVLLETLNMVARDDQLEAYHREAYYLLGRVDRDAAKKWAERKKEAK
jgi:HEAT repeat protein